MIKAQPKAGGLLGQLVNGLEQDAPKGHFCPELGLGGIKLQKSFLHYGGNIFTSIDPLTPRNFIKGADLCIYLPPLTYIYLTKESRETADQQDAIGVMEHCGGGVEVPVSQVVAQS